MAEANIKLFNIHKAFRLMFVGMWIILICWRFYILIAYSYKYVDDDQALMWYGTVHFANGHFPEPCFFGQDYNSMLESLLGVPLYLCGWPLNYALPTVVSISVILPFLYYSVDCYRRNRIKSAFAVLFLFSATAWQWDVLSSIPHAIISGFPWALVGVALMCDPKSKSIKRASGSCLCVMGTVVTMSTAAVMGIAWLYYILDNRKKWRNYVAPLLGTIPGIVFFAFQKWYYTVHIDDIVVKSGIDPLSKEAFALSVQNISELIGNTFGFGKCGVFILPAAIVLACIIWVKNREWEKVVLIFSAIIGSAFALTFGWMLVYDPDCVMLPQSRMVMFWVFIILELILLFSYERFRKEEENGEKYAKTVPFVLAVSGAAILCMKTIVFTQECKDVEGTLYRSGIVSVMSVDELKKQSQAIIDIAEHAEAEILVTTAYSAVMTYGASALHYNEPYTFYIPDRDRRVWVYHEMENRKNVRLLLYSMPVDANVELSFVELGEASVTDFFDLQYGIVRGGDYSWGIK